MERWQRATWTRMASWSPTRPARWSWKGAQREAAERAHGVYADSCPVYRSLKAAIAITTELDFRPE